MKKAEEADSDGKKCFCGAGSLFSRPGCLVSLPLIRGCADMMWCMN